MPTSARGDDAGIVSYISPASVTHLKQRPNKRRLPSGNQGQILISGGRRSIIQLDKFEFDEKVNTMNHHASRYLSELLNNLRKREEDTLQANSFVGGIAKGYKYSLLITAVFGIGMGYFLFVPIQDPALGLMFGVLGIVALLLLPTYFSYRCHVDQSTLKAEYYILFFKIKREVHWKDVEYKAVKRDSTGNPISIRLYNSNQKKLASFDYSIVGFGKIVRRAKKVTTLKR